MKIAFLFIFSLLIQLLLFEQDLKLSELLSLNTSSSYAFFNPSILSIFLFLILIVILRSLWRRDFIYLFQIVSVCFLSSIPLLSRNDDSLERISLLTEYSGNYSEAYILIEDEVKIEQDSVVSFIAKVAFTDRPNLGIFRLRLRSPYFPWSASCYNQGSILSGRIRIWKVSPSKNLNSIYQRLKISRLHGNADTVQLTCLEQSQNNVKNFYNLRDPNLITSQSYGLLLASLFGESRILNLDLEDDFKENNILHLLIVSGYQISLVIFLINGFSKLVLRSMPRLSYFIKGSKLILLIAMPFVLLYGYILNFEMSFFRALLAVLLIVLVKTTMLKERILILIFSLLMINIFFPLRFLSLGYQLMTAALFSIAVYNSLTFNFRNIAVRYLANLIILNIIIFLLSAPIIFLWTGKVDPSSIIANCILAPIYSLFILIGFVGIIAQSFGCGYPLIDIALLIGDLIILLIQSI